MIGNFNGMSDRMATNSLYGGGHFLLPDEFGARLGAAPI
jgi:hypothetical protein